MKTSSSAAFTRCPCDSPLVTHPALSLGHISD